MQEEKQIIKLLLTDDHQMLLDGIRSLLRKEKDIEIIAEAKNGKTALEILQQQADSNNPIDVLLTDISMPQMDGVELTRLAKLRFPDLKILVLTMHDERALIEQILAVEAEGYILKNIGRKELIKAIKKVAEGSSHYSPEVLEVIMQKKNEQHQKNSSNLLTKRETEIVQLICKEYSSAEIAETLFISTRTVETHRKNILHKINVKNVVGLIKFAFKNQLV
jgi:DNA-binding NarL/FixJ family response regulator